MRPKKVDVPTTPQMIVDYMTFSHPREDGEPFLLPPFEPFAFVEKDDTRPLYGYNSVANLRCGGRVMWHTERLEMGYCFTLAGQACNDMSWQGVDRQEFMDWLHVNEFHFSRVDFALDIVGADFVPIPIFNGWYRDGHITTKSKKQKQIKETVKKKRKIEAAGGGVYLGGRDSALMVRYYDKAAERKILGVSWARLEAEIKKDRARAALGGINRVGWRQFAAAQMFYAMGVADHAPDYVKQWHKGLENKFLAAPYQQLSRHEGDINKFIEFIVLPCVGKRGGSIRPDLLEKLIQAAQNHLPRT